MKSIAAAAACVLALVLALGASAGSNGGAVRDHGQGKWYKHACDRPTGHDMSCHAQVVTDSAGTPLVVTAPTGVYGPAQIRGAYALTSNGSSSSTIAIVDAYDAPHIESDLSAYSTAYGLPSCTTANGCFRKVDQSGGTSYPAKNGGWDLEIALDVEAAHGVCPNCRLLLVEARSNSDSDLYTAENTAAALGATVISNSWGGSEYSGETSDDQNFNHPGIPITVSSGDGGYGVEYPAASQYVTAVGGTTLSVNGTTRTGETAWSGSGSGCSAYEPKPSWQKDGACSKRTVADVSADADPNTGLAVYTSDYSFFAGWYQVGGTSLAAPIVASVYALAGGGADASTAYSHTSSLHDVTSGSNGSCGGSYLCTAVSGFDGPTGLGTPNGPAAFTAGGTQQQPDFTIGTTESSVTVTQGADATYHVNVAASGGFSGTVALSSNAGSYAFSPPSVSGSGGSVLTVHTAGLAPNTYTLSVTGTSGSTTHSTSVTLVVQAAQAQDFALSVSPSSGRIGRTSTTTYTVTVTPSGGFSGSVTLTASYPTGLSGSFSPSSTKSTSTFTVRASRLQRHRSYTITITGTSGSLVHSAALTLST